jgi:hypothetical protein
MHEQGDCPSGKPKEQTATKSTETWDEIFAKLDAVGFPPEFMAARDQGQAEQRDDDH